MKALSSKRKISLVWRMTLTHAAMLFLLLAVFTTGFVLALFYETAHTRDVQLTEALRSIEGRLSESAPLSSGVFRSIRLNKAIQYSLYNQDRQCLYTTVEGLAISPSFEDFSSVIQYNGDDPLREDLEDYEYTIASGQWFTHNGSPLYLFTFKDVTEEMEIVEKIPLLAAVTLAIGLILSFVAGRLVSRSLIKPISRMAGQMQAISASNLSERLPETHSADELEELTHSFNHMIERLEQSFARQKQFVSDASHELRTPLAVMQGHTAMLLRWGKDDPTVSLDSLRTMQSQIRGMSHMIDQLLMLARNDDASIRLHPESIPAGAFLQEAIDEILMIRPDAQIHIHCDVETIYADRAALQQVLRILLDNSAKFCPPPGAITLSAAAHQGGVLLTVADEGPGIDDEKLPYIFDRFFRADDSRTKHTGGTGLGLAIAKSIVESHGGAIEAQSKKGAGTIIRVWLKSAKA